MKIALVSFEYPPFHGGGIGTYAGIMSRALARAGHEVHVIANGWLGSFEGRDPAAEGIEGLSVHRVAALDRHYEPMPPYDRVDDPLGQVCRRWEKALFWSYLVAHKLAEVRARFGVEVVEFPECFAEGYTAFRWRAAGIDFEDLAMCVHLHTPIELHTELNLARTYECWFRRRVEMEACCIRDADLLCSPSRSLSGIVRRRLELSEQQHPCEVIPYAMDFEEVPPAGVNGRRPESRRLLFVGRIEPRKGVRDLVDAAVRLMDRYAQLEVHFLGRDCEAGEAPGSMKEFLMSRVPLEHQSRFVFEGLRPREDVLQRYGTATACVFAAPWDNFPFTCFEAMSQGACIVASDQGGMAEVIEHDVSGVVFPSRDVGELTRAIAWVLDHPERAGEMRVAAVKRVREVCDPASVVEQRLAFYRRAVERRAERVVGEPE